MTMMRRALPALLPAAIASMVGVSIVGCQDHASPTAPDAVRAPDAPLLSSHADNSQTITGAVGLHLSSEDAEPSLLDLEVVFGSPENPVKFVGAGGRQP